MMMWIATCFLSLFSLTAGKFVYNDPYYLPGHDVMVQLFEWKWNDIAKECEQFLGPKGFGGVQVSPVQENLIIANRPWWERYQIVSYKLITRSGTREQFIDMVRRCNKAGVRIYVDIILNHMSGDYPNATGVGGTKANPSTRDYPGVPYSALDFNPLCSASNFNDPIITRNCELVGLHDLNPGKEYVREKMVQFLNDIVDIGVAGFRVDAAVHMWPGDLEIIFNRVKNLNTKHGFPPNSRPFIVYEVYDWGDGGISKYEYTRIGVITEFRFSRDLSKTIGGQSALKYLISWGETWGLAPSKDSLVFIDNHDSQRDNGRNRVIYKSSKLYKMANVFMLAHTYGIPRVMSSYDFKNFDDGPPADAKGNIISPEIRADNTCGNGWICEHRWRQIYNMVRFRNSVSGTSIENWWDNLNNQIAFSRGNIGFVAFNGEPYDMKVTVKSGLPPGKYCDVISGDLRNGKCTGKVLTVDKTGQVYVEILTRDEDGVIAIHRGAIMK